ncbi:MAG: type II toxin-antitoxin system RelB/DinJ family antitoxin [Clostridia bacterium]|nr:type II toxin-antitoxin system RelB/DinJ family antitoxin [Clostridia bacterium]
MEKAFITIRTDDFIKRQATELLANMGMDMTTGINVFLRSLVRSGQIPFTISSEPSVEYREWMKQELAKSYELAQNPETPRMSHEEFWREFDGVNQ